MRLRLTRSLTGASPSLKNIPRLPRDQSSMCRGCRVAAPSRQSSRAGSTQRRTVCMATGLAATCRLVPMCVCVCMRARLFVCVYGRNLDVKHQCEYPNHTCAHLILHQKPKTLMLDCYYASPCPDPLGTCAHALLYTICIYAHPHT